MAIVQSSGKKFADAVGSGTQNFTASSNFTAGNTGILTLVYYNNGTGGAVTGVTIGGTAAVKDASNQDAGPQNFVEIWRATNMAGGTNAFSVTISGGTGQYVTCGVDEHSGLSATPLDQSGTANGNSLAPSATTGGATADASELLVAAYVDTTGTNVTSVTPPTSWTESWEEADGATREGGSGAYYYDSSGTGTKTGTFGVSASTTWEAVIATYKLAGGGGPAITSTSSATPAPGSSLTITGTAFQASQGAGFVTLGGVTQTVTSWADTSITITVIRGAAKYGSQNIVVRDNGGTDSSGYVVTLTPPTGFAYVDLASVNSTAAWRIVTVPDLAIGDQISYPTAGGLVVANDATFSWTYGSLRSFDSEVWTSADGWGAVFTQYLAPAFSTPPQPPSQIPRIQRRWPRAAPDPFDIVGSKTGVEKWFAWELTVATGGGITADAADTATFSDSAVSTSERLSTAADTFTPSDSAVSVSERLAVASDTFAPSDSAVSVSALVAVAVDTVTFSDSAVETPAFAAEASDTFTPSDSAVSTTDRLAVAADTFAPSDSAVSTSDRLATASDTFSPSDTAVSTSDRPATASDTFSPSDSADALNAIPSDGADTVTFSDSALSTSDRTAAASDTFSPSDSAVSTTDRPAVADDTVTFSDSAVGSAAGGIAVDAADTITLTDSAVSVSARGADAADTFTPSDSAVSATDRVATATDALVFSDSAVAGTQPAAVAADTINLDDSAVAVTIAPTAGGGRAWLRSLLQERYTREFEAYAAARRAAEVRKADPLDTPARPLSEPAAPPAPRRAVRRAPSPLERELEATLRQLLVVARAPAPALIELPSPVNLAPVADAAARSELTAEDEETLLHVAQMLNL